MTPKSDAASRPDDVLHSIARRMVEAIDRAVEYGMIAQANRLASHAVRLAGHSSRLTDCIARLRLLQNDAQGALVILEAHADGSTSMQLLKIACMVQLGRVAEAHLLLNEWSRSATAPLAARRMLALLDAASARRHEAVAALTENLQHVEDPASLELLCIVNAAQQRSDQARHWAERLRQACIVNRATVDVQILCESLDLADAAAKEAPTPSPLQVTTLAMELAASPDSLAVLVQHQEAAFEPAVAQLVYQAASRALHEFEHQGTVCESLARLARLLGDEPAAIEWTQRGLQENSMSASLAMLLEQLQGGNAEKPTEPTRKAA